MKLEKKHFEDLGFLFESKDKAQGHERLLFEKGEVDITWHRVSQVVDISGWDDKGKTWMSAPHFRGKIESPDQLKYVIDLLGY